MSTAEISDCVTYTEVLIVGGNAYRVFLDKGTGIHGLETAPMQVDDSYDDDNWAEVWFDVIDDEEKAVCTAILNALVSIHQTLGA